MNKFNDSSFREKAYSLRQQFWQNKVFLRGIVEFSNFCRQDCLYCGLRASNSILPRYRLDYDTIFNCSKAVKELGINTVVLQSGEDTSYDAKSFANLISKIKIELDLAITLSLGERTKEDYELFKKAGADRFLLKIETFCEKNYAFLRPNKTLKERLTCLENLRHLDYDLGSGIIAGLPNDTEKTLNISCEKLAALELDMISISPFTAHKDSPLAKHENFDANSTINIMALMRCLSPKAHIPVTSALSLHGEHIRLEALKYGNVIMPSLTPENFRTNYAIYDGKNDQVLSPVARAKDIEKSLITNGYVLGSGYGQAYRRLK